MSGHLRVARAALLVSVAMRPAVLTPAGPVARVSAVPGAGPSACRGRPNSSAFTAPFEKLLALWPTSSR